MKRHSGIWLLLLIALAILAGFFVYPNGFGDTLRPWRLGLDLVGGSHLTYQVDLSKIEGSERESVLNGLRDVIEQRVNLFGVSEPQIYIARAGEETNLVVELAGIKDVSQAIQEIGETPFLEFYEVLIPEEGEEEGEIVFLTTGLTGQYVSGAQLDFDPTTRAPEINFSFNDEGAELFREITARNIGSPLCVFVDEQPIIQDNVTDSCPTVQDEIVGGRARITGQFTIERARELVERFNAGALPAPITLISQRTVGATLGADSLTHAVRAGVLGTILVMVFMILYYRIRGIFAAVALALYIVFTLAVFKLIPVTLTLAGLAGFVLTIGMAVDANILIFERIKEEGRRGLSQSASVRQGFKHAWSSIRDANTSTLITAIILYYFTTSFVQGFALTLFVGVLVSLLSAVTTTRLLLNVWVKWKEKKSLPA